MQWLEGKLTDLNVCQLKSKELVISATTKAMEMELYFGEGLRRKEFSREEISEVETGGARRFKLVLLPSWLCTRRLGN